MFSSPTRRIGFREPRELDRAGEARRPGADEQHVQLHRVAGAVGPFLEDEPVERERDWRRIGIARGIMLTLQSF